MPDHLPGLVALLANDAPTAQALFETPSATVRSCLPAIDDHERIRATAPAGT